MTDSNGQPEPRSAAEGEEPLLGEYPPFELTTISAQDVARMPVKRPGPVTLQDRQGVFAHSFKCSICDLEFVVFSWRADRHRVGSTFCPECGAPTPMLHWRAQTSESLEFCSDGPGREIYQMFSASDAPLMVDSVVPADDRYAFPDNHFGIVPAGTETNQGSAPGLAKVASVPAPSAQGQYVFDVDEDDRGIAK